MACTVMEKSKTFGKTLLVSRGLQPPDRAIANPSGSGREFLRRVRAGNKQLGNTVLQSMAAWGIKKKKSIFYVLFKMPFKRDFLCLRVTP